MANRAVLGFMYFFIGALGGFATGAFWAQTTSGSPVFLGMMLFVNGAAFVLLSTHDFEWKSARNGLTSFVAVTLGCALFLHPMRAEIVAESGMIRVAGAIALLTASTWLITSLGSWTARAFRRSRRNASGSGDARADDAPEEKEKDESSNGPSSRH